jgi:hypothetical protein
MFYLILSFLFGALVGYIFVIFSRYPKEWSFNQKLRSMVNTGAFKIGKFVGFVFGFLEFRFSKLSDVKETDTMSDIVRSYLLGCGFGFLDGIMFRKKLFN